MTESRKSFRRIACLATLAGTLAGCSGSNSAPTTVSNPASSGGSSQPAVITGIVTPTTVSVVTATNAN